ncbi:MAG: OmpA family protein [Vicingaceae bacterium]
MYLKLLSALMILCYTTVYAQNIVQNGSFEELNGRLKEPGSVFLAPPWVGATKAVPDLYSPNAKDERIRVPENAYGDEKAKDGENYAGLLLYSYGDKEPRHYLTQKLKYPMLAGEWYCVKFNISFADLSKYASDNIGCYISQDSIGSETDLFLNYSPQVINSTNRIFEKQWDWEDICRIYVADGGEQFITIGNFAPSPEVKTTRVRRPTGYTQTQTRDGYYFIDDISITPNATRENCKCEPGQYQFAHLDKDESSFETAAEDIPEKMILSTNAEILVSDPTIETKYDNVYVNFEKAKSVLAGGQMKALNEIAEIMSEDKEVSIKIVGHRAASERVISDLSQKRANQVSKYLISKGIDKTRITTSDAGASEKMEGESAEDEAKNMIVDIIFSE